MKTGEVQSQSKSQYEKCQWMEEINSKTVNVNNRKIATENLSFPTKRIFMGEKKIKYSSLKFIS